MEEDEILTKVTANCILYGIKNVDTLRGKLKSGTLYNTNLVAVFESGEAGTIDTGDIPRVKSVSCVVIGMKGWFKRECDGSCAYYMSNPSNKYK